VSHPVNKRERFLKSKNKGLSRAEGLFSDIRVENIRGENNIEKTAKLTRNTTKLCSCAMCGNARKFFGEKTRQEKKADESSAHTDE
jgi:hypothetical protein